MPELPDITVYIDALQARVVGRHLETIRLGHPFVLRTARPPLDSVEGQRISNVRRIGKRIALRFENDLWLVMHLMIAGRLHWRKRGTPVSRKVDLAAFDFAHGTLLLTEAGSKKRASLHLVNGDDELAQHDPGGLEVLTADLARFRDVVTRENHTLKRALTDPRLLSGIGNAYSDEILHRARLSPVLLTHRLTDAESGRLYKAARTVLSEWIERLRQETGSEFPEQVTAFRAGMAVHGRFGKPCPVCGSPVQRIRYAANETNYCATCQTGGRLLADRALSRLLKRDWPKTVEELA